MTTIMDQDVTQLVEPFILLQVVNNKNAMGRGVAKAIADKWPQVLRDYREFFRTKGVTSENEVLGQSVLTRIGDESYVVSMIAQDGYGMDGKQYLKYLPLGKCLAFAEHLAFQHQLPLYAPYLMGCGLAGGNWGIVSAMLSELNVTICKH